ncbi:M23 family metallopeptidase [Actinotalea sp. BY-33]|uniref:M23 family metallopeptidase n=1 Tax=Actinotalea soli TaxID=2819234 RepID=A0A939LR74_9CELL|nr:M23 family metallopeptidase [Actinotalea soli]MBO1751550.1 M23 family metallopeptidase [Actinotalea soli]
MTTWRPRRCPTGLAQPTPPSLAEQACRRPHGPRTLTTGLLAGALLVSGAAPVHGDPPGPGHGGVPAAARSTSSAAPAAAAESSTYRAPVDGTVVRLFDPPPVRWAAGHRGVDLAAGPGDAVMSPSDGVVTFAGRVVDRGVLTVTHPDGRRSSFEPVVAVVVVGQVVAAGEVVATVAPDPVHCASTCLHWGVREGDEYVDPLSLLPGAEPVVLLR